MLEQTRPCLVQSFPQLPQFALFARISVSQPSSVPAVDLTQLPNPSAQ